MCPKNCVDKHPVGVLFVCKEEVHVGESLPSFAVADAKLRHTIHKVLMSINSWRSRQCNIFHVV